MIHLEGVTKRLGGRTVLDRVDLHVLPGETYVLLGPSGTGKSVTLKHIVGLLRPDSGTVSVDGQDLASASREVLDRIRIRIGYVFQSGALVNWLNVGDNVALPLREHRLASEQEIQRRVSDKLTLVHLEGEQAKMPDELSGGMRKRVGIARALMLDPPILLFDEPTSGLDPVRSRAITHLIAEMDRCLKVTNLVVTHDLEVAFGLADRIGFLYRGHVVVEGVPEEIRCSKHAILKEFLEGTDEGLPTIPCPGDETPRSEP